MLGDRVGRLAGFGGEHRLGIGLRIVLRPVAEPLGVRIVVPGTPVVRDAIDDLVADVGMLEPDPDELGIVARADPDRQPALVDRLRPEIADARAQHADPVLVGIEAGERLAKGFADPVAAVGPRHDPVVDLLGARIEADRVVAGGEDDALDAGSARRLEDIVKADDVALEDHRPLVLARDAAEMDDAVDAGDHSLDRRHVGEFGAVDLLPFAGRRQRDPIGKPQDRIDATQSLAQ